MDYILFVMHRGPIKLMLQSLHIELIFDMSIPEIEGVFALD